MPLQQLFARTSLSIYNTAGIVFGILTLILSILSVVIAWAMWQLKRREDHLRQEEATSAQPAEEDLELQRIRTNHDGNGHEENHRGGIDQERDNN
jgi:cytochrome oxidase assembly protein ShyY1